MTDKKTDQSRDEHCQPVAGPIIHKKGNKAKREKV